jgi:hypothetical protein
MHQLNTLQSKFVSAGADAKDSSTVLYGDNYVHGTVTIPPSQNGQVVYLSLQVVENNWLHKLFT